MNLNLHLSLTPYSLRKKSARPGAAASPAASEQRAWGFYLLLARITNASLQPVRIPHKIRESRQIAR